MRVLLSAAMSVVVAAGAVVAAQSHPEVVDAGKAWTQKTPWGDPDIAGAWTSDDMRGVPRERAAAGADLDDVLAGPR